MTIYAHSLEQDRVRTAAVICINNEDVLVFQVRLIRMLEVPNQPINVVGCDQTIGQ